MQLRMALAGVSELCVTLRMNQGEHAPPLRRKDDGLQWCWKLSGAPPPVWVWWTAVASATALQSLAVSTRSRMSAHTESL